MNNEVLENHKRYSERADFYRSFGYDLEKERDFILAKSLPVSGKILEAGTGKGHFSIALAKQGYSFVAFDISQEELNFTKLNLAYLGLDKRVDFRIENAEHTSFADKSFDVIFSVNTLHHFCSPFTVIDELVRILSHNGKIVLSDFTKEGFKFIEKVHALEGRTHEVNKQTPADFELYLIEKGFSIKKVKSTYQWVLIAGKGLI